DEARTEAVEAGEVLVAGRLVDLAFGPEGGFDRHHRQAVGLHRAVAAAFADRLVDEDAPADGRHLAAFAASASLGGADLVVDQHGDPGFFAQFALDDVELVAVADRHVGGEIGDFGVFFRLVGDDDRAADAFRRELAGQPGDAEVAVHRLAAGHRDGVVVEDLVGDRHVGRDRLADGEQAGVEVGAVAEVGENVLFFGERGLTDPGHAFAAHVGE